MLSSAIRRYWPQYKWSNIFTLIKNIEKVPSRCAEPFTGKLVVITGATSGVGYHTARKYASMGARLLLINRNLEKSERVRKEIADEYGVAVEYVIADLAVLADIQRVGRHLAELASPIDVLIHNAGLHHSTRKETADGLEVNFALHYLAPFVITSMLMPKMARDRTGRIILVSSEAYRFAAWGLRLDDLQWQRRSYAGTRVYGAGKLAQLLSMHLFARELGPHGVTINAMHPGMVRTETGKDNGKLYKWYKKNFIDKKSASAGISADALYYLGASSEVAQATDRFFHLTTEEELAPPAVDLEAAEALWVRTIELLRQKGVSL